MAINVNEHLGRFFFSLPPASLLLKRLQIYNNLKPLVIIIIKKNPRETSNCLNPPFPHFRVCRCGFVCMSLQHLSIRAGRVRPQYAVTSGSQQSIAPVLCDSRGCGHTVTSVVQSDGGNLTFYFHLSFANGLSHQ